MTFVSAHDYEREIEKLKIELYSLKNEYDILNHDSYNLAISNEKLKEENEKLKESNKELEVQIEDLKSNELVTFSYALYNVCIEYGRKIKELEEQNEHKVKIILKYSKLVDKLKNKIN